MHRDFKELFASLNAEGVRYLVVGGYAVSLHAEPRATKDLDILVDAAKLASGRTQDLADAEALQAAAKTKPEKP